MIRNALSVNIAIRVIENICNKFDIQMKESHKSILAILIPAIIYRDGSIVILSETIHQIDRILKKKNNTPATVIPNTVANVNLRKSFIVFI